MSRHTKYNPSLTEACLKLNMKNNASSSCFFNVCALLAMGLTIAKQRDQCDPQSQTFVDHYLHTLSMGGNLVKMVATCRDIPDAMAVSYVTGNTATVRSLHRTCQHEIGKDKAFKDDLTLLFGSAIAGLFDRSNPKRKQLCEQIEKSVSQCEEAETLLHKRY